MTRKTSSPRILLGLRRYNTYRYRWFLIGKDLFIDLKTLISVVADWHEIDVEVLRTLGNDRRATQIRGMMAHLARSTTSVSLKDVANFCGRADNSMSQAATRFEDQIQNSEQLKAEVNEVKAELKLALKKPLNWKCEA